MINRRTLAILTIVIIAILIIVIMFEGMFDEAL